MPTEQPDRLELALQALFDLVETYGGERLQQQQEMWGRIEDAMEELADAGIAEGLRQAAEGWEREWGLSLHGHPAQCVLNEHAARGIAADPSAPADAKVLSRLVGPWEPAEQPEPAREEAKPLPPRRRYADPGLLIEETDEDEPVRCNNLPGCPMHPDVTFEVHEVDGTEIRGPRLEAPTARDPDVCPKSRRVDGPLHSWRFDGDDPRIICAFCDEMRDAQSGAVIRPAREDETPEGSDR